MELKSIVKVKVGKSGQILCIDLYRQRITLDDDDETYLMDIPNKADAIIIIRYLCLQYENEYDGVVTNEMILDYLDNDYDKTKDDITKMMSRIGKIPIENTDFRFSDFIWSGKNGKFKIMLAESPFVDEKVSCNSNNPAAEFIDNYKLPRYNLSPLRYDAENTEFCGRDKEIDLLTSFVNDEKPLLWWAITGDGGVGKSRLAFEFMQILNNHKKPSIKGNWKAIMVDWKKFFSHIKPKIDDMFEWNTENNYLIIIDYVQSFEQEIASFIQSLAALSWPNSKVRILLIERARKTKDKDKNIYEPLWYRTFKNGWNSVDWLLGTCHSQEFINLSGIEADHAINIIKSYVCFRTSPDKKTISDEECSALIDYVSQINNQTISPLLLLSVTEIWLDSPTEYTNPERLSSSSIWAKIIDKEKKEIAQYQSNIINEALLEIHAFACIVRRLKLTPEIFKIIFLLKRFIRYKQYENEIISSVFASKYCISLDYNEYLTAIEPDIIGEYYVYTILQKYSEEDYYDLIVLLHILYKDDTQSFFWRYNHDFSNIASSHPAFGWWREIALLELKKDILKSLNESCDKVNKMLAEQNVKNGLNYDPNADYDIEEKIYFSVPNEQGEEKEYEILFTLDSDETGKSYMIYTDNSKDEKGNTSIFASAYAQDDDETELLPIETEKEWEMIEQILKELQADN